MDKLLLELSVEVKCSEDPKYVTKPRFFKGTHNQDIDMCIVMFKEDKRTWLQLSIGYLFKVVPMKNKVNFKEFVNRKEHNPFSIGGWKWNMKDFSCNEINDDKHWFGVECIMTGGSKIYFDSLGNFLNYLLNYNYTTEVQYHHYIPVFMLRNFSNELRPKKKKQNQYINTFSLIEKKFHTPNIKRIYGIVNMYANVTNKEDIMVVEKLWSKRENLFARWIYEIKTKESVSQIRDGEARFKLFLFAMKYRTKEYRGPYLNKYDGSYFNEVVHEFMVATNLRKKIDVWLLNMNELLTGGSNLSENVLNTINEMPLYHLAIWEAGERDEFIISDTSCGICSGGNYFHVISPKLAIVLVNSLTAGMNFTWELEIDEYEIEPKSGPNQTFEYKKTKVSRKTVNIVNAAILHNARESISYKSDQNLYRAINYYRRLEMKWESKIDYSWIRKELFNNLNKINITFDSIGLQLNNESKKKKKKKKKKKVANAEGEVFI
ncbi:hypothetical protein HDV01_003951 [Terramyces sp. JEL0728]|nr:hypothetical protein HDV01_003951 [Terramyces sp. JEL0728]